MSNCVFSFLNSCKKSGVTWNSAPIGCGMKFHNKNSQAGHKEYYLH